MNFSSPALFNEKSVYFSADGLAIILFPLEEGQPTKLLRHVDGLLRGYVFTPADSAAVRVILRQQGAFRVLGFKLLFHSTAQEVIAFAIPAHAAAGLGVLDGQETKTLRRLLDNDASDSANCVSA